jgi:NADH:ubiquinone oxidoreductase subunit
MERNDGGNEYLEKEGMSSAKTQRTLFYLGQMEITICPLLWNVWIKGK